ncbi:hypothetical protein NOV72_01823 [Caballeronia novacaledonica]|uniref:Uncharacterized protein n=1 Tax=Caballeronia novacaledonica TaxID=1544861 RepID=A0A2U3I371_9BURK|nr:hypothetical protein NOV72_01823 [Caballeronia novacaledonica]
MALLRECLKAVRMKTGTWNADERYWPASASTAGAVQGTSGSRHSLVCSCSDAPATGGTVVPVAPDASCLRVPAAPVRPRIAAGDV